MAKDLLGQAVLYAGILFLAQDQVDMGHNNA
jgi:hypothetical protein